MDPRPLNVDVIDEAAELYGALVVDQYLSLVCQTGVCEPPLAGINCFCGFPQPGLDPHCSSLLFLSTTGFQEFGSELSCEFLLLLPSAIDEGSMMAFKLQIVRVCDSGHVRIGLHEQLRAHISDSKLETEYVPWKLGNNSSQVLENRLGQTTIVQQVEQKLDDKLDSLSNTLKTELSDEMQCIYDKINTERSSMSEALETRLSEDHDELKDICSQLETQIGNVTQQLDVKVQNNQDRVEELDNAIQSIIEASKPMKTCLTAIPGHPGKKMGHTSSTVLDPTCSISTDTLAKASDTDFNQVEDFKQDLLSRESHLAWTGYNPFKTFTILTFSSYRTPQGCRLPISAGSNLEDALPPTPIFVT
ncbi:hypothetical protein H671_2g6493 [Cricetulus griseus]|uniref:Uncharacterized protein n=1 Tax=Cricetulus griseus TaxID=10029 RepID=A0A061IE14_CRIGR|nr:hypothetical protein H671_2g6493 [Cricetulus griseus]